MHLDRVTQVTCQDACLERGNDCKGISCSAEHDDHYDCTQSCYVCKNLNIVDGNERSDVFIKKPGILKFTLSKV